MQHEGVNARPHSRILRSFAHVGTAALIIATASLAAGTTATAEITVHTADEVLADWVVRSGDDLHFQAPDGRLWKLVTDIDDPVISNKGQGAFFPVDPEHVHAALDAVTYPFQKLDGEIFILPFPREALLPSSAEFNSIVLSPGVAPVAESQVHALVSHELGHVVHNAFFPEWDRSGWSDYRRLRGIEDETLYNAAAAHRDRPREIFAEDIRALFGGPLATYSGSIENPEIALPRDVAGLEAFLRSLAERGTVQRAVSPRVRLPLYPNPTRAGATLALAGPADGTPLTLTVVDITGRLVAHRTMTQTYQWDGRDDDGRPVAQGLYLLRAVRGGQTWVGKLLVSR